MNKTFDEVVDFFERFNDLVKDSQNDIIICPPSTLIGVADEFAHEDIALGAQNLHPAKSGAYTGEISATMISDVGADYVLIGHSERRAQFGETDEFLNEKVKAALAAELTPIFCIGETLAEREGNKTEAILAQQIKKGLVGVKEPLVVAYEPVWAIGTGKVATLEQIKEAHAFVNKTLKTLGLDVPVLYGGSVNEKNAAEIMAIENVDGVLVGGASLDAEKFATIANV